MRSCSRSSRVGRCAGETAFDIEAVGEDGAGFVWLPQDSLPHSSLAFELPLEEEEQDDASSDGDSAVSAAETADLSIVDPEVSLPDCQRCLLICQLLAHCSVMHVKRCFANLPCE